MSDIPEAAVEAVLGTQHIQDHLGGSIDADDVRSILEAAMPVIRAQLAHEIRAGISEYQGQLIEQAARIVEGDPDARV